MCYNVYGTLISCVCRQTFMRLFNPIGIWQDLDEATLKWIFPNYCPNWSDQKQQQLPANCENFQEVQIPTLARAWYWRLFCRALVTQLWRTWHWQFRQEHLPHDLRCWYTGLLVSQVPLSLCISSVCMPGVCLIPRATSDQIPPPTITMKWTGNHSKSKLQAYIKLSTENRTDGV